MKARKPILAFLRVAGFFLILALLFILLPAYLVGVWRENTYRKVFYQQSYERIVDLPNIPNHPQITLYESAVPKGVESGTRDTRVREALDQLEGVTAQVGIPIPTQQLTWEVDVFALLRLHDASEQELAVVLEWFRAISNSQYDSKTQYLILCSNLLRAVQYRLDRNQIEIAAQLVDDLKGRIYHYDGSPADFYEDQDTYNGILLHHLVYQNPELVREDPTWFKSLINRVGPLQSPSWLSLEQAEVAGLYHYFQGLDYFHRGGYAAAQQQFRLSSEANRNFQLRELSVLMEARCMHEKGRNSRVPDTIEASMQYLKEVVYPKSNFANYQDDIQIYINGLQSHLSTTLAENRLSGGSSPQNPSFIPGEQPSLPNIPKDGRYITREEWIQILRAALKILEDGN